MDVTAFEVLTRIDDETVAVWFRFSMTEGSDDYFRIERAIESDEQDRALDLDTYYCELSDQSRGGYRLLESFRFRDTSVQVEANVKGKADLGIESLLIRYGIDDETRESVRSALTRIFDGESCFVDEAGGSGS